MDELLDELGKQQVESKKLKSNSKITYKFIIAVNVQTTLMRVCLF